MNRTRAFVYNTISTAVLQVITLLAGLITPRIMLQFYGSEINGLVTSINQFISYFSLVEAGLANAAVFALYKPLADNDHKAINGVVCAAKKFYTQSGFIFVSLTLGLAVVYPAFVRSKMLSPLYIGLLVVILGVSGSLEFFTLSKYRALLTADQKTYVISLASIAYILLSTFIIVALSMLRVNIVLLRFAALFAVFLRSFILMAYAKIKYKYLDFRVKPNKSALKTRWDAFYLQILGSVQTGAPVVLITIFSGLKMVSVYSVYNMVIGGVNGILSIFTSGLSASFGDVIARGDKAVLQESYREFEFSYYSLITIVYAVALVTIMPFVHLYTRNIVDANYNLPVIGFLLVLNGWLYNFKTPQGMLVMSAGLYRETRIQSTIQAAIILVGGAVLTPLFGLVGAIIASCLSNLYRDIDLMFFIPKYVTGIPAKETAARIFRMSVTLLLVWLPTNWIEVKILSYSQWLLYAMGIGVYAVAAVSLCGALFDRRLLKNVCKRCRSLIMKK